MLMKNSLNATTVPGPVMPESQPDGKLKWEVKVWTAADGGGGTYYIVDRPSQWLADYRAWTWPAFELVHIGADGAKRVLPNSRTRSDARDLARYDHKHRFAPQMVAAELPR
jgi:hypothetical protein